MPVDLSMVGLKGIEAGQNTLNAIANREALAAQTRIAEGTFDREEAELQLERDAVANAKKIMAGEGRTVGGPTSTEEDMARFLALSGEQLAAAGAPKRGGELITQSLDLIKKKGEISKQDDDQAKVRLENMVKGSNYMYEMLSDSMNESEYQFNLANIPPEIVKIIGPENVETLRNTPWSPELIDYFKTKALSVKDQAQLEMQAQGHRRAEEIAADAKTFRALTYNLSKQRVDAAERERVAREKASGGNVSKAPTNDERTVVRGAIAEVLPEMGFAIEAKEDSLDLMGAINDLTGEAKQLLADSPGLNFTEAANRVVLAAKARGDFEVLQNYRDFGLFRTEGSRETRYKAKGKTREAPAPLPSDKSKMVRGRFYEANGKVLQYGTDFE